jgi:Ca-activated chloride channel homolog
MRLFAVLSLLLMIFASPMSHAQNQVFYASRSSMSDILVTNIGTQPVTISKQVREVDLVMSVTDKKGHFVHDLQPAGFVIYDNSVEPDEITYFESQTNLALRVAVVVDTSESVSSRFTFEQRSAEGFLRKILRPEEDLAMVVGFNHNVVLWQKPTNDVSQLASSLHKLKTGGETALNDAIAFAADQLTEIHDQDPVRRIIILLTDGEENRSALGVDGAVEHALRAGAVIYVVNTRDHIWSQEDQRGANIIEYMSESTGGRVLPGGSEEATLRSFHKIEEELRSQYALGYQPPAATTQAAFHQVQIVGPEGVKVRCRRGYFAK